ncbi:hypothetical protein [Flavivirga eckloniae]|nr:hypothetical protein [Flavivirga eckloniae]
MTTYSQVKFEKGYYINNKGERGNCLIKNIDWKNTSTEFKYKLAENSEKKKATITAVKEFGILNDSKYIRSKVKIDRSPTDTNTSSYNRNPEFKEEDQY